MKTLTEYIGKPAVLEQLAEECAELGKAALKMSRYLRGENPVFTDLEKIKGNLEEEIADVDICLSEIRQSGIVSSENCVKWIVFKQNRMKDRFMRKEQEEKKEAE